MRSSINWLLAHRISISQLLNMKGICVLLVASLLLGQFTSAAPDTHFLRSLKSDNDNEDNANSGHFMRALRSDHFLRALRAYGSKDLQRILRSDPNVTPNNEEEEDEFSRPMRTNGDHFLRSLRSSDHFLRSLRSAHDFMRMVRSGDHFLRSLKSDPVEN